MVSDKNKVLTPPRDAPVDVGWRLRVSATLYPPAIDAGVVIGRIYRATVLST
jgi:hypothetical protein